MGHPAKYPAEFRLELPGDVADQASVVLYANPGDDEDTGPSLGVQLWGAGDAYAETNLWRDGNRWRVDTHRASGAEPRPA